MRFMKMHGTGNDFVLVDLRTESVDDPAAMAVEVCRRHFGVGADGLILVGPSETADVRMRIINADGSEAEMCGNGVRCVAKFSYETGLCRKETLDVETGAGVKTVRLTVEAGRVAGARVDMGEPRLRRGEVPMLGPPDGTALDEPIEVEDEMLRASCLSMGNPHCVVFVEDIDSVDLGRLGPALERHPLFPERVNAHFVEVVGRDEARVKSWERGAGATLACGTGASAVCVAGFLTGRTERSLRLHVPGGDLELEFAEDNHVCLTGPAEFVFEGEWG